MSTLEDFQMMPFPTSATVYNSKKSKFIVVLQALSILPVTSFQIHIRSNLQLELATHLLAKN